MDSLERYFKVAVKYQQNLLYIVIHHKIFMLSSFSYSSLEDSVSSHYTSSQPQRPSSFVLKVFPIVIILVTIVLYFWQIKMDTVTSVTTTADSGSKKHFLVVLFGDSLINVPCGKFGLQMQLTYEIEYY